jgi:dual specificity phosphatase 12
MTQLTENLWVGSLEDAFDTSLISHVTHILNVASELMLINRVDHVYSKIAIEDDDINSDIRSILPHTVAWIKDAMKNGGKVLVHCLEGKSRSVCVCIAYLCLVRRMSFDEALQLVTTKRKQIDIYPLYFEQLKAYIYEQVKK